MFCGHNEDHATDCPCSMKTRHLKKKKTTACFSVLLMTTLIYPKVMLTFMIYQPGTLQIWNIAQHLVKLVKRLLLNFL